MPDGKHPSESSPRACICTAEGVTCREDAQVNDVLCRSCRLHHERPYGPQPPLHKRPSSPEMNRD
jgi:hypothetical protein